MSAKSIATGGLLAALALACLYLTAVIPTLDYALPALAGVVTAVPVLRREPKTALAAYAVTAFLAFVLLPRKDAALYYTLLFGHYPIVKSYMERISMLWAELLAKLGVCAVCLTATGALLLTVLGVPELPYPVWLLFPAGCVVFFVYDFALTRLFSVLWSRFSKL